MKTRIVLGLALPILLITAAIGCSTCNKMELGRVMTSGRDGWQLPEQVIRAIEIEPGSHVAEIGAGGGYWLPWLSEAVGPEGKVYAVEVTDDLVAALSKRVARDELANVVVIRGQFDDPNLPDGEIDLAMTSQTYHHIEERPAYFRRLQTDLRPGGRVVHLDDRADVPAPIRWLQSSGHWSEPEVLRAEMFDAGYRFVSRFDFLPMQSLQVFVPATE